MRLQDLHKQKEEKERKEKAALAEKELQGKKEKLGTLVTTMNNSQVGPDRQASALEVLGEYKGSTNYNDLIQR